MLAIRLVGDSYRLSTEAVPTLTLLPTRRPLLSERGGGRLSNERGVGPLAATVLVVLGLLLAPRPVAVDIGVVSQGPIADTIAAEGQRRSLELGMKGTAARVAAVGAEVQPAGLADLLSDGPHRVERVFGVLQDHAHAAAAQDEEKEATTLAGIVAKEGGDLARELLHVLALPDDPPSMLRGRLGEVWQLVLQPKKIGMAMVTAAADVSRGPCSDRDHDRGRRRPSGHRRGRGGRIGRGGGASSGGGRPSAARNPSQSAARPDRRSWKRSAS